jgi:hypothetical protein
MLNALPTSFSTPELNVPCAEGEPHTLVDQLVAKAALPLRPTSTPLTACAWTGPMVLA